MRLELGIKPLVVHRNYHYFRIYVTIQIQSSWIDKTYEKIGFIHHCFKCGFRTIESKNSGKCPECKSDIRVAGPLWTGQLFNQKFLIDLIKDCENNSFKQGTKLFKKAIQEIDMPSTYFVLDNECSKIGISTPNLNLVISALIENGFQASRTSLNCLGVKTDAPPAALRRIIKRCSENYQDLKDLHTR
jgi:tRNA (guanine26-N2/guanine27-N2)-dimethyltransferase